MKGIKTIFAVVLALTLVMGLSITTFAGDANSGNQTLNASVPISITINDFPDPDDNPADYALLIQNGFDGDVVDSISNVSWSGTYSYNASEGKTAFDAIDAVANTILTNAVDSLSTNNGTAITGIFTIPNIDNYGNNSWSGYYWRILISGVDQNNQPVTFESPYYTSAIPLVANNTYQVFTGVYNGVGYDTITCKVTGITVQYYHASYTW